VVDSHLVRERLFFEVRLEIGVSTTNCRPQNISGNPHNTPRFQHQSNERYALKMAGGKKKKKPASNPARGFATTSIASKTKAETANVEPEEVPTEEFPTTVENQQNESVPVVGSGSAGSILAQQGLTPEEFEKQLEESELQVLVEKHAQKSKRDALRQQTRLETDRRVLRGQAENLNTRKWLPPELMEEILDLVKGEGRYSGQTLESSNISKHLSEEELTIRLWTLQQSLVGAGFIEDKISQALQYVLDISDKIGLGNKDTIWGMEESLDWLSRECSRKELPDYEYWHKKSGSIPRSQTGMQLSRVSRCRHFG
jgi:ATP-dependent RNA helicase DHX29